MLSLFLNMNTFFSGYRTLCSGWIISLLGVQLILTGCPFRHKKLKKCPDDIRCSHKNGYRYLNTRQKNIQFLQKYARHLKPFSENISYLSLQSVKTHFMFWIRCAVRKIEHLTTSWSVSFPNDLLTHFAETVRAKHSWTTFDTPFRNKYNIAIYQWLISRSTQPKPGYSIIGR